MKTLDEQIREAFQALDQGVPESYYDTFPSRLEKLLEVQAMEPETPDKSRDGASSDAASGEGSADAGSGPRENTGLHDIKAMARTTKNRISQRITTQSDIEESLLVSSSSGLKAVVLPTPGKDKPTYEAEATADEPEPTVDEARGGLPFWVYGAVGAVAVAAVVFFVIRGRGGDEPKTAALDTSQRSAATEPGGALDEPTGADMPAAADEGKSETDMPADPAADDDAPSPTVSPITPEGASAGGGVGGAVADPAEVTAPARKRDRDSDKRRAKKSKDKGADKRKPAEAPKADSKPPPPPADKAAGGPRSLEDILDNEMGGAPPGTKPGKEAAKPVKKAPAKTELGGTDIRKGMRSVLGRVQSCYTQHKKSGTVKVSVTVSPDGSVAKASATGEFAGSKTGACVATAVKAASFPAWDGRAKTFKYSYLLSD